MLEETKGVRSNKCIKILYWETIDCTFYLNDNFSEFYTTLDIWVFVRTWRQHFFYFYAFFSFQRAWQPGNTSAKPTCRFVSRRRKKQHFQRQFHLGTSAIQVQQCALLHSILWIIRRLFEGRAFLSTVTDGQSPIRMFQKWRCKFG